jgi:sec-independent protein translocase protein TatA
MAADKCYYVVNNRYERHLSSWLLYTSSMTLVLLAGIGPQEIMLICVAALVLFGATKVPQFMRGLGQGVKEFKQAVKDDETVVEGKAPEPPASA